jgi:hypothetical protein
MGKGILQIWLLRTLDESDETTVITRFLKVKGRHKSRYGGKCDEKINVRKMSYCWLLRWKKES